MITTLRHLFVDSWAGRAAAFLIFLAFIGWGVGDVFNSSNSASPNAIAKVGDREISAETFARALETQLPNAAQRLGYQDIAHLPKVARQQIAREVLRGLVIQQETQLAAEHAGMSVPDSMVRDEIFNIPAFHDAAGQFDRSLMNQRIARMGLTEKRLIELVREDIISRSLLQGVGASAHASSILTNLLVNFESDTRRLSVLRIPFADHKTANAPTEEQLRRFYDNHPSLFKTPEFRHIKAVLMTPDTVASTIDVSDEILHKLYDMQSRTYNVPETRSLQVLSFTDRAKAQDAANHWKNGTSWDDLIKANPSAIPATPENARQSDLPNAELAQAAFAAPAQSVQEPVHTAFGWVVFKVTDIIAPHHTDFAQVKDQLRHDVQHQQAPEALQARMHRFQDAISGSSDLEKIPSDLGATPIAGTLDAQGMTPEGVPAPIPGSAQLRTAIIQQAFAQKALAAPHIISGPENSAYALIVDAIHPGSVQPFENVRSAVTAAWAEDQAKHLADLRATTLYTQAKKSGLSIAVSGQPEANALWQNVDVSRVKPDNRLPNIVTRNLFTLKAHESAMYQSDDAFWLVTLDGIESASPADRTTIQHGVEAQYTQSLQMDIPEAISTTLEKQWPMTHLNMPLFNQVVTSAQSNSAQ
ncbi:peptidylprolyl isomerase [Neokomagataea thailandica]|uniref:Parvulin-like PPIase n=1 Tax=Neokomagataea tanensis NBRC 106556 TaxID=1223519 RepID=A0ABQ0QK17_9PROT|nr:MULTISPECIES: peptidylprolyl isomerase [Neokomagataea]GBR47553.1 peptidyl-prolyl cis-trans isomerase [Neokomagataea tanensis NBRC 106556]